MYTNGQKKGCTVYMSNYSIDKLKHIMHILHNANVGCIKTLFIHKIRVSDKTSMV